MARITMKSLAKFGFCLTILLTSVAGKCLIGELILVLNEVKNVLFVNMYSLFAIPPSPHVASAVADVVA